MMRQLGKRQLAVLEMMKPEWIGSRKTPDSMSLKILRSLQVRGLVYENFGRWSVTSEGQRVKEEARNLIVKRHEHNK